MRYNIGDIVYFLKKEDMEECFPLFCGVIDKAIISNRGVTYNVEYVSINDKRTYSVLLKEELVHDTIEDAIDSLNKTLLKEVGMIEKTLKD